MKRLRYFILLVLIPTLTSALNAGLGKLELHSALHEPFEATIKLPYLLEGEANSMQISLADDDAFSAVDIHRVTSLNKLKFDACCIVDNNAYYIRLYSHEPIHEPVLRFLVKFNLSNRESFHEYAVLLHDSEKSIPSYEKDNDTSIQETIDAPTQKKQLTQKIIDDLIQEKQLIQETLQQVQQESLELKNKNQESDILINDLEHLIDVKNTELAIQEKASTTPSKTQKVVTWVKTNVALVEAKLRPILTTAMDATVQSVDKVNVFLLEKPMIGMIFISVLLLLIIVFIIMKSSRRIENKKNKQMLLEHDKNHLSSANKNENNVHSNSEKSETENWDIEDKMATKLDLAKAYIELGDRSTARSLLDEVMLEGNKEQREQAEKLWRT